MSSTNRTWAVAVFFGIFVGLVGSLHAQQAGPGGKAGDGLRVVHVGNSHSHPLRVLDVLAPMAGHTAHKNGEINILGAPLRWNWDHPEQNKWKQTLAPENKWDAITLLSWGGDDDKYAPLFTAEALKGNPKCQVFIYTIWPDASMDFEKPDPIRNESHTEKVAAAVEKVFPDAPKPRVIPASLIIRELARLADRGELPNVASRFELYADGGHLSQFGQYAVNALVCAMLYDESPLDYPADIYRKDAAGKAIRGPYQSLEVPAETAEVIKRLAWDILLTYPPAGMKRELVIGDRRFAPVIAGQPYRVEIKALNAEGKCAWTLAKGALPKGLELSADGVLSGQSDAIGNYPVTIKVNDGKAAFERVTVLQVNEDKAPAIVETPLPKVSLDTYVFQPVKATGGVGHLTWAVSAGQLPYGIRLSRAGILVGTPGQAGEYKFTITATDSHPAGPRSAERQFAWSIGPATPEAMLVAKVAEKSITIDGKLDEPFWALNTPIQKKTVGTPAKKASFAAVWGEHAQSREKGAGDALYLAVKVMDGPAGKTAGDAIHVFIDGRHNREVIYNADDTHFLIRRDGRVTTVKGKPNWFVTTGVTEIDGGFVMEIKLSANYFIGEGNWLKFGLNGVYGFDIAIDEGAKEVSQQVWRGNEKDAEDTSAFGIIVMTDTPAAK